jgi:DNA repair protein RecO (recombination protein O)
LSPCRAGFVRSGKISCHQIATGEIRPCTVHFPVLDKTRANLLRRFPLTETSLIIHWCSDEFGILKTVAKGARRPKSPFAGKLDLYFDCEIEFVRARSGDLHILKDLELLDARFGLRSSWLQTQTAAYFGLLVEQVTELEAPIPELADLLRRALDYLAKTRPDRHAVLHFEKETARQLGVLEGGQTGEGRRGPIDRIADVAGRIPPMRSELMQRLG